MHQDKRHLIILIPCLAIFQFHAGLLRLDVSISCLQCQLTALLWQHFIGTVCSVIQHCHFQSILLTLMQFSEIAPAYWQYRMICLFSRLLVPAKRQCVLFDCTAALMNDTVLQFQLIILL